MICRRKDESMEYALYIKAREEWKDKPDKTTPVDAKSLNQIEGGVYKNSENIRELSRELKTMREGLLSYEETMEVLKEESEGS